MNVYCLSAVIAANAGDHTPVIPFIEVDGIDGTTPEQTATGEKDGVTFTVTGTVTFAVVKHPTVVAVNVYSVAVVIGAYAGDHVPVTEFVEVVGNEAVAPEQIAAGVLNAGTTFAVTGTVTFGDV